MPNRLVDSWLSRAWPRQALIVVAVLAAKGVVLGGVLYAPLVPHTLRIELDSPRFALAAPADIASQSVVDRLCQWDCGWYAAIMARGYVSTPNNASAEVDWAFFPAFPLLSRWLSAATGLTAIAAAVLLNCCLCVAAALLLHALAKEHLGERAAWAATLLFAFSPFSLYLTVPYTEALFNALSLGAVLLAGCRRWLTCGLCVALLTATRPTGILLAPAILMLAWRQGVLTDALRGCSTKESARFALCLLCCPLGLAAYMAHLAAHTGDALAFSRAQVAWGKDFSAPFGDFLSREGRDRYNAIGAVLGLVAAWRLWRMNVVSIAKPAALFLALTILLAAASSVASLARYAWALWPAYLPLGAWLARSSNAAIATVAACALCAGLLFAASAMWPYGWYFLV